MFGAMVLMLLIVLGGAAAIVFSILAWRLQNIVFFILGWVFTGLILIYVIVNIQYYWWALQNSTFTLEGIMMLIFIGLPLYFLIAGHMKSGSSYESGTGGAGDTGDGFDSTASGQGVTIEYLDDIINEPDEEIDFDADYD